MNILYLHGLKGSLSPQKREILEKFGKVYAPDIDYSADPKAIESILKQYTDVNIDAVIGSSMGGFAVYYVSTALNSPALLFNPALKWRSVEQSIPEISIGRSILKQFVIGAKDEVVNPADTLKFISENYNGFTDFYLHLRPELTHQIPEDVFEEEVGVFFGKIGVR
jgi:hypothetical protein